MIAKFHVAIAEKMKDIGVSVRKSALRIQSDILLTNPEHELRTEICCKLIDSVTVLGEQEEDRGEEERKMAMELFQQLWFCALPSLGAENEVGDGGGGGGGGGGGDSDSALEDESSLAGSVTRRAVRGTSPAKGRGKASASSSSAAVSASASTAALATTPTRGGGAADAGDRVTTSLKQRVEEIAAVVQHCRNTSWLQELLHSIFSPEHGAAAASAAAEKGASRPPTLTSKKQLEAARRATAQLICVELVDALVLRAREAMCDEPDEDEAGGAARRGLACLQALAVFSAESPALLARHVDTLGVYLVPSTERVRDKQLCLIITLITRALPLLARPDPEYLRAISERLRSLIASCGVKVMERSARCMGLIATMMPPNSKRLIRHLFVSYFTALHELRGVKGKEFAQKPRQEDMYKAARLLRGVGSLARYYDFDSDGEQRRAGGSLALSPSSSMCGGAEGGGDVALHVLLAPGNVASSTCVGPHVGGGHKRAPSTPRALLTPPPVLPTTNTIAFCSSLAGTTY